MPQKKRLQMEGFLGQKLMSVAANNFTVNNIFFYLVNFDQVVIVKFKL